MTSDSSVNESGWRKWDDATYGLIYGCIVVLSLLMAMGQHPDDPLLMAGVLFASVTAIALAKAFAEVMADSLDADVEDRRAAMRAAWHHSRPTLTVANVPAFLIGASGLGLLSLDLAIQLSQVFCVVLLLVLGGRVGWVVGGRVRSIIASALFTGGIGVALATWKYVIH